MDFNRLNPYQQAAVLDDHNATIVNAHVGSGKTTVLIAKIEYLHTKLLIPYEDMVVFTFTNKAANEIRERLSLLDTVSSETIPYLGTFHGVCLQLLRRVLPLDQIQYSKDFTVMTPEEEMQMCEQLILSKGFQIKYKNRLKKRLELAQKITDPSKRISKYGDDLFLLIDTLSIEKRMQNKMTFQDLILHTSSLLEQNPDLFRPQYLIIDEVQDCDAHQLALISQMKKPDTRLFAVGDPNQVIYSFRGSAFQIFYQLKTQFDAQELSLPINYRSSDNILRAAHSFSQNSAKLTGVKESGSKVVVDSYYDSFQEATALCDKIKALQKEGVPYEEIAILYRLQNQSKTLCQVFSTQGIPYSLTLRRSLADSPVLSYVFSLCRFLANPQDTTAGCGILTDTSYGEGLTTKKALKQLQTGYEYMTTLELAMLPFQSDAESFFHALRLDQRIKPNSATYEQDHQLVIDFLAEMLSYLMKHDDIDPLRGMAIYLDEVCLQGRPEFLNNKGTGSGVHLMTLHASKGLEFSHVFIIGVNNGLLPIRTNCLEEEEEERRLLFVGMTRAQNHLELSYYSSADGYQVLAGPSRFLQLLRGDSVEFRTQFAPRTAKENAMHLQDLKRQILQNRENATPHLSDPCDSPTEQASSVVRVRHGKYGDGSLISDDGTTITIEFDDYGQKEFIKMITPITYL